MNEASVDYCTVDDIIKCKKIWAVDLLKLLYIFLLVTKMFHLKFMLNKCTSVLHFLDIKISYD